VLRGGNNGGRKAERVEQALIHALFFNKKKEKKKPSWLVDNASRWGIFTEKAEAEAKQKSNE
jgi:hypothetical protein